MAGRASRVRRWAGALALAGAVAMPAAVGASRQAKPRAPAFDVFEKSIPELQAAMASGVVTSRDLVEAYLARIRAYDHAGPALDAMIALNPRALDDADALDKERAARGPRGPLHGIPVVIKDNYETAGMPTTGGSIALAGFEPGRDAFMVRKLREAGAVIVGKTNLHELASGITTISSLGGQTRNPYDPARVPGGSSGGTGAAVAADFAAAGMGSDTCGSIRIPSANNNLFGLRGTLGLSSRTGIIPLSHTQDIGGPLARTVTDLAIMLDATVGLDPADATTAAGEGHVPRSYRDGLRADALKGRRIGILTDLFGSEPDDREVGGIVLKALEAIHEAGAETVEVKIPGLEALLRGSSVIDAEFKFDLMDYLARFPNAPVHSLGEILDRGAYHAALEDSFTRRNAVPARETDAYRRARIRRTAVRDVVLAAMDEQKLDALVYPTLRRKPAVIGEAQEGSNCQMSPSTGFPAIAMPAGFTDDGLPVGVELLGRAWAEPDLLAMAYAYEKAVHPRRPPPTTPPLVNGAAPPPATFAVTAGGVRVSFTYDRVMGGLTYRIASDAATGPLLTVALHRGGEGETGPVVATLLGGAALSASGATVLAPPEREALERGGLYLDARATAHPDRPMRAQIEAVK